MAQTDPGAPQGSRPGAVVPVVASSSLAFVGLPPLGASEVLVLASRTAVAAAGKPWPT